MAEFNTFLAEKTTDPSQSEATQLLIQSRALLDITKSEALDEGRLEESLRQITEAAALGLNVERASIWLFNENRDAIFCIDLYERSLQRHTSGMVLLAADFPAYFKYLKEERTLPAHDAHTDPSTFEFSKPYLKPLNIMSMLDAPIRKNGQTTGVICSESVGAKRQWTLTEQAFAGAIADMISRAFIAHERVQALRSLQIVNENLENLVQIRTQELEAQRAAGYESAKMASLGVMSAGVAHEINTPLATIQLTAGSLLQMAEGNTPMDKGMVATAAHRIEATTERIAKIIRALRAFSRDVDRDSLQIVPVKQLIDDTLLLCSERFYNSTIQMETTAVPADLSVECRPVQIQQVLLHLLNNSFDAIAEASDKKWIRIVAEKAGPEVQIQITDSGSGIPPAIQKNIMEPFFTTKGVGKGIGLGLSVANGLMQSNNGRLELDPSCPNTCFKLSLRWHL